MQREAFYSMMAPRKGWRPGELAELWEWLACLAERGKTQVNSGVVSAN